MSEGTIFLICVFAMFPTVIIAAVVVKLWEVRKAKRWHSTTGKVLTSAVKSRKLKPGDEGYGFGDSDVTNEPDVEYTYQVGRRMYRGRRITIGEKTSSHELEAILARYPVGAAVTVYYNPGEPKQAVLERDLPMGVLAAGVGCLLLFFIGAPLLAALLFFGGLSGLKPYVKNPDRVPFVAAATGFGLLLTLFAIAFQRVTAQARKWPVTRGRVVAFDVEAYRLQSQGGSRKHYKPTILYTYEVNGQQYQGDRVTMGVRWSGTMPGLAKRAAAKYIVGQEVDVYYDLTFPTDSGRSVVVS